jgi:hypothetical protein
MRSPDAVATLRASVNAVVMAANVLPVIAAISAVLRPSACSQRVCACIGVGIICIHPLCIVQLMPFAFVRGRLLLPIFRLSCDSGF